MDRHDSIRSIVMFEQDKPRVNDPPSSLTINSLKEESKMVENEDCRNEKSPLDVRIGQKEEIVNFEISETAGIPKTNTIFRQILGTTGCNILPICSGAILGYTAILFPQLREDNSGIKLSIEQESWIASVAPLMTALGSLFSGYSMDRFGRKSPNICAGLIVTLGWSLIFYATCPGLLLTGRFVMGFGIGLGGSSAVGYVGEVTEPKMRGVLLAFLSSGIALGALLVHLLGTFYTWRTVALVCAVMPLVSGVLCAVPPESYIWYLKKNRLDDARKSFFWFRGFGEDAQKEFAIAMHRKGDDDKMTVRQILAECRKPRFVKPFLILNLFFAVMQLSGNHAISFYAVSIMKNAVPSLNEYASMFVVDILRFVMSLVACVLTKRFRVRPLTFISVFGTAFSLYFIATSAFLSKNHPDNEVFSVMSMAGFVAFIVIISVGLIPLPWVICSEILPPATKGFGSGVAITINFLIISSVVKTNPNMFEEFGEAATYSIYATITLIGGVILDKVLPETKNKTLKEIERMFSGER